MSFALSSKLRFVAALLVVLQAWVPFALMATGMQQDGGVAAFLCSPSGQAPTPEAIAAAEIFADLADDGDDEAGSAGDHCPLCALAHGTPMPRRADLPVPHGYAARTPFIGFETRFAELSQGPPLGSRAPPFHA